MRTHIQVIQYTNNKGDLSYGHLKRQQEIIREKSIPIHAEKKLGIRNNFLNFMIYIIKCDPENLLNIIINGTT